MAPVVGYAPIVGTAFERPSAAPSYQETYTVGTFTGSYDAFVPVAGARWSTRSTPMGVWATIPPQSLHPDARLELGAFAGGEFVPAAYVCEWTFGAGAGLASTPVLAVALKPAPQDSTVYPASDCP